MIKTIPYVYLIGWKELDIWYYGRRTADGCSPDDLWVKYFTSSKVVKKCRSIHGEPDVIMVRRTFDNKEECAKWETKVLRRLKISETGKWLNLKVMPDSLPPKLYGVANPFYGKHHKKEDMIRGVNTRRRNGGGDYHQGKPSPFDNPILREENAKRFRENNPAKDRELIKIMSSKRIATITTFKYWHDNWFKPRVDEAAYDAIMQNAYNLSYQWLRDLGLTYDFAKSVYKKFSEELGYDFGCY